MSEGESIQDARELVGAWAMVDIGLITLAIPDAQLHDDMRCRALRQMPLESCRVSIVICYYSFGAAPTLARTLSPRLR